MSIRVNCPKCRAAFACPDEYRGKALRCKKCGQRFVAGGPAPHKSEPAKAVAPPRTGLTPRRFGVAAVLAVLLGAGIGLPAAWFLLKKHHAPDELAAGQPTEADHTGLPPTGKQGPPRETGRPQPTPRPVEWSEFTSRDWGFSARFPGEPKRSDLPSLGGKAPQTFEGSAAAAPGRKPVTVSVTCEERETADAAAFLAARAAEIDREGKATNSVKLSGFPGVEVRAADPAADWLTTHRFYLVRARAYHLVAGGPADRESAALARQFLDSFKLLDPGEPEPARPPTPQERAHAWLAENAAANVGEKAKSLLPPAGDRKGFTLAVGAAVAKSKKPALLAGWGGELFVFELSADQARALKVGDSDLLVNTFAELAGRRPEKPTLTLSDLKLDAEPSKLTGSVAYRGGGAAPGALTIRVSHPAGPSLRVRRLPAEAKESSGTLPISGPPLTADDPQLSGPVVVFVEACSAEGGAPEAVLSNAVAAVVTVTPGPPKGGLAELQLMVPRGWKANYNKYLGGTGGWELTKPPPTPRSEDQYVRIEPCPPDALTAADYTAHLKEKDWLNVDVPAFVEVGPKEDLPDGFVIKGVVKKFSNAKTPPVLGFVAVRDIAGLKVRCSSANLRSADSLADTLEAFKAAGFGPPK